MKWEDWLREQYKKHKGDWLTWDVVKTYRARVEKVKNPTKENKGKIRNLEQELMDKYGILEIEAVNIVWGYNAADYVHKYVMMKKTGEILRDSAEV